jgi:hypothetical protein
MNTHLVGVVVRQIFRKYNKKTAKSFNQVAKGKNKIVEDMLPEVNKVKNSKVELEKFRCNSDTLTVLSLCIGDFDVLIYYMLKGCYLLNFCPIALHILSLCTELYIFTKL